MSSSKSIIDTLDSINYDCIWRDATFDNFHSLKALYVVTPAHFPRWQQITIDVRYTTDHLNIFIYILGRVSVNTECVQRR